MNKKIIILGYGGEGSTVLSAAQLAQHHIESELKTLSEHVNAAQEATMELSEVLHNNYPLNINKHKYGAKNRVFDSGSKFHN